MDDLTGPTGNRFDVIMKHLRARPDATALQAFTALLAFCNTDGESFGHLVLLSLAFDAGRQDALENPGQEYQPV